MESYNKINNYVPLSLIEKSKYSTKYAGDYLV